MLNGDSAGDEPEAIVGKESEVKPYDPNTQRRVVRERLHALEIINERFARQFRMGLFNLLRRSPTLPSARSKSSRITSSPATCRCRPT